MMKLFKLYFILIFLLLLNSGCQSLRDGLEGNKKSKNAEEFLIENKSPLVLPPDFSELPIPKSVEEKVNQEEDFDLKKILGDTTINTEKTINRENNSTEKSILEKIKEK